MAKNTLEGNRTRTARRRKVLAERGIRPVQVLVPESAHPLIRQAATLMTRESDPMDPRAALRRAGGSNEPEGDQVALTAELASVRAEIEVTERQKSVLQAERDAARKAEAAEREKAQAIVREAGEAQERAIAALRRAEKAEATIRQAKTLPGLKGQLVRWLAGNLFSD